MTLNYTDITDKTIFEKLDLNRIFPSNDPLSEEARSWIGRRKDDECFNDMLDYLEHRFEDYDGGEIAVPAMHLSAVMSNALTLKAVLDENNELDDKTREDYWNQNLSLFLNKTNVLQSLVNANLRKHLYTFNQADGFKHMKDPEMQAVNAMVNQFCHLHAVLEDLQIKKEMNEWEQKENRISGIMSAMEEDLTAFNQMADDLHVNPNNIEEDLEFIQEERRNIQKKMLENEKLLQNYKETLEKAKEHNNSPAMADKILYITAECRSHIEETKLLRQELEQLNTAKKNIQEVQKAKEEFLEKHGSEVKECRSFCEDYTSVFHRKFNPVQRRRDYNLNFTDMLQRIDQCRKGGHGDSTEFRNMKSALQNMMREGNFTEAGIDEVNRMAAAYLEQKRRGMHVKMFSHSMRYYRIAFAQELLQMTEEAKAFMQNEAHEKGMYRRKKAMESKLLHNGTQSLKTQMGKLKKEIAKHKKTADEMQEKISLLDHPQPVKTDLMKNPAMVCAAA